MICFTEDLFEFDVAPIFPHSTLYLFAAHSGSITSFESTFDDEVHLTGHDEDSESEDGGDAAVAALWVVIQWYLLGIVIGAAIIGVAIALCVHFRNKRRINGTDREKVVVHIPDTSAGVETA